MFSPFQKGFIFYEFASLKLRENKTFAKKSEFIPMMVIIEPKHEISKNVACATSTGSDQPAHTRSLIRAFASRLNILLVLSY